MPYYCNGEILYQLKGTYVKTTTLWNYKSEYGAGDMYSSIMRGSNAILKIQQGPDEAFKPVLYIIPKANNEAFEYALNKSISKLQKEFEGVKVEKISEGYKVVVPAKYIENHEEHFARVVQSYLGYLDKNNMPSWEVPNMLAKYYTTSSALTLAQTKK